MPKYTYNLIEETILEVEIDAESREEADGKAENMIYGGDLDWGMGSMGVRYELIGEENAQMESL